MAKKMSSPQELKYAEAGEGEIHSNSVVDDQGPIARILNFPEKEEVESRDENEVGIGLSDSELFVQQLKSSQETADKFHKILGLDEYRKCGEMILIKKNLNGLKTKRFVSTQGILVNKKQA